MDDGILTHFLIDKGWCETCGAKVCTHFAPTWDVCQVPARIEQGRGTSQRLSVADDRSFRVNSSAASCECMLKAWAARRRSAGMLLPCEWVKCGDLGLISRSG